MITFLERSEGKKKNAIQPGKYWMLQVREEKLNVCAQERK